MKSFRAILLSILFFPFFSQTYSQCDYTEVTVTSITGNWGDEMSWDLSDTSGVFITGWQGFENYDTVSIILCLENGCYSFTANDSYGDGWNGGSVQFTWDTGNANFELTEGVAEIFYFGINASDCIPKILGCTDPEAFNYNSMATIDDGSCLSVEEVVALQKFDTICYSGAKDNRVNWVIQNRSTPNPNNNFQDAAEFRNDLEDTFIPAFTIGDSGAKVPYAQYKDFFNLYAAWWPDAPGDHTWWHFDLIKQLRDEVFLPWDNDETGWVTWFSTTKYGGGGGSGLNRDARVGDGKMYGTHFETLLHEFGHTMPGLLDEYTSSGEWSGNQCFETPNTTQYTVKDSIPWRKWMTEEVPLPTPYDGNYENVIGAFEGGLTNYFDCHRPTAKGCYMGAGGFGEGFGQDLCSPCVQRVICFLYKYVNVIENPIPESQDLTVTGNETIVFSADVVAPQPNTQKYEWFLNGKLIAEQTKSVEVTFGNCDQYELVFAVTDTTDLVRYDEKFDAIYPKPYREFKWTINQEDIDIYFLTASGEPINADCTGADNGMINLTVNGGQPPYEYWLNNEQVSNPVSELNPGNHDLIIVDAKGCSVEESVNVGQESLLDLQVCSENNGTWQVSAIIENYDEDEIDLLWSTGEVTSMISGISNGDYAVTATVNGCSVSESFSLISAQDPLTVSHRFFPSEIGAATGAIYLEVEGGVSDYDIKWYDRLMADKTNDNTNNIFASGTTWDHLPQMAFDDDLGTKWLHAVNSNAWIWYEFPEPLTVVYYTITSADDVPERDPKDWRLEGSNNGEDWIVLDTRQNEDFPDRYQQRAFPVANPAAFKYCRLFVENSAGEDQIQLQELEFIGTNPNDPFLYNPEFDDHLNRSQLAPGDYRYEIGDASSGCAGEALGIAVYEAFTEAGLGVVKYDDCRVIVKNPQAAKQYYWLSDETGTELLGEGIFFEPPAAGNYYVASGPIGSDLLSSNRKGFAITMPDNPIVDISEEMMLMVINPKPDEVYFWYESDECGVPVHIGIEMTPGSKAATYFVSARSTVEYPEPIDPATLDGLVLRMDASDLDGDGVIDDPAPATSSVLDWNFSTGNHWHDGSWFAYRANYQNGLGIADWATLWLQRIENEQSNFQTVIMAYQENALSWEGTGPMEALSVTMPRHSDETQLYSNTAPAITLNGSTYLNGELVAPLNTANPMEFCVLGSVFTDPSNEGIFYTDTHWEGKVGELLFYDHALSDVEMKGISEFLRQKWISSAELESARTQVIWEGIDAVDNEKLPLSNFKVAPNPVKNSFILQTEISGQLVVKIFDLQGKMVIDRKLDALDRIVGLPELPGGSYFVKIINEEGKSGIARFVKM